jgi:hypothetical protein
MATAHAPFDHPIWKRIAPQPGRGGFWRKEFSDPDEMDPVFLGWLYDVRQAAGVPFRINSSARDPEGSVGATRSAHKKRPCRAVDLQCKNNYERFQIVRSAFEAGCVRIGIYPSHEDGSGPVHLDLEGSLPQGRIWTRW